MEFSWTRVLLTRSEQLVPPLSMRPFSVPPEIRSDRLNNTSSEVCHSVKDGQGCQPICQCKFQARERSFPPTENNVSHHFVSGILGKLQLLGMRLTGDAA